jgi:hypothetical protein
LSLTVFYHGEVEHLNITTTKRDNPLSLTPLP